MLGPVVGGYLTDNFSWRWVFYINVPIGLCALLIAWAASYGWDTRREPARVDLLGAVLFTAGLASILAGTKPLHLLDNVTEWLADWWIPLTAYGPDGLSVAPGSTDTCVHYLSTDSAAAAALWFSAD